MKIFSLFVCFIMVALYAPLGFGQDASKVLSMQEAINIALENNHDIKISENNSAILNNNAVMSNAGYLPTVSLSGTLNYSNQDTYNEFASSAIEPIDVKGAETQTINAGVDVSYNIYSGGNRKYQYEKLKKQAVIGDLQERQNIEVTVNSVIRQYLTLINLYSTYELNQESIDLSNDRYSRVFDNYNYGNIGKLELLNAEVDLSNDSSSLVQAEINYIKGKNELNILMGISPENVFLIDTLIELDESLQVELFLEKAREQNSQYLIQKGLRETSIEDLRLNNSQKLPSLNLSGGYAYARTEFGASFIKQSENLGWNAGITLRYNVFDGNRVKRNEQNALILIDNQEINIDRLEKSIQKDVLNAFEDYSSGLDLIQLRQTNLKLAEANYNRSKEAFSSGQITGIEFREAQLNLLNAKYSLTLQTLQTKNAEVNLYFLSGSLVEF